MRQVSLENSIHTIPFIRSLLSSFLSSLQKMVPSKPPHPLKECLIRSLSNKHPAILLLGICPRKTKTLIWKDICTPMFMAALFTTALTWKQLKCPLTEEWIKKVWHIYVHTHTYIYAYILTHTMEYYSVIKRMTFCPFAATWMDLEGILPSEIRQIKTNTVWYHL